MKKFFLLALLSVIIVCAACGNKKSAPVKITPSEAKTKLAELSTGLEVHYDDMKGFTLCRCRYDVDESIIIVPYVLVYDKDFSVSLGYHIMHDGAEPLHFDTMYVKTLDGVKKFKYKNVSILYGYRIIEEYHGDMDSEVYKTFKQAINDGYAKIRLEGRQMDERELSQPELVEFKKVFDIYEFFNSVKVVN